MKKFMIDFLVKLLMICIWNGHRKIPKKIYIIS
nr:MAG TPA: hypothetical protein [Caudoviricetes sp.]